MYTGLAVSAVSTGLAVSGRKIIKTFKKYF